MPSDERVIAALAALAPARDRFRAALSTTLEHVRAHLADRDADGRGRAARLSLELGRFAEARLDADRFAAVFAAAPAASPEALARIRAALVTLEALADKGDDLFRVDVAPDGVLAAAIHEALAEAGRAFGAARAFDAARSGGEAEAKGPDPLDAFPFRRWSGPERRLAPPLVVRVHGAGLRAAGLAGVLDDGVKIALVVDGPCPPAPLARLVTPGTLVIQTDDAGELAALAEAAGPAIGALLEGDAARFIHRPNGVGRVWDRLTVSHWPAEPTAPMGGLSRSQQLEELRLLRELAEPPSGDAAGTPPGNGAAAGEAAAGSTSPPAASRDDDRGSTDGSASLSASAENRAADRLATWLLDHAGLER